MKKLFKLLACGMLVFAASCSQGGAAVDEAYGKAQKAESAEIVANALCSGDIKVKYLTSTEMIRLGACIGYITATGVYTANFESQVDMHQYGDLLEQYRKEYNTLSDQEKQQIDELTAQLVNPNNNGQLPPPPPPGQPGDVPPPPPGPAPEQPGDVPPPPAPAE